MNEQVVALPPRKAGLVVHALLIGGLLALGSWALWRTSRLSVGPHWLYFGAVGLTAWLILLWVVYRGASLCAAQYLLSRDGFILRWGLRRVQIPMVEVLSVQTVRKMEQSIRLPWLHWPGAVLGRRQTEADWVEFLAADTRKLVVIATSSGMVVISPQHPAEFLDAFERMNELGTLSPLQAQTYSPWMIWETVWRTARARYLMLGLLATNIGLFAWSVALIAQRDQLSMGFDPALLPHAPVPAPRLLLVPAMNVVFSLLVFMLGMVFFHREEERHQAYVFWAASLIFSLGGVFLLAVLSGRL